MVDRPGPVERSILRMYPDRVKPPFSGTVGGRHVDHIQGAAHEVAWVMLARKILTDRG